METALNQSWRSNAAAWTDAVRQGKLASRVLVTDDAVLAAVLECRPTRVLDVGCGEGWLARRLHAHGCQVVGIDGSPALIESAQALGGGDFHLLPYERLTEVAGFDRFDVAVCNFSLLGEELPWSALQQLCRTLVIQTLHPWALGGDYQDGERLETFAGMDGFREPMPWRFRTLETWLGELLGAGFRLRSLREPRHPDSGVPLSLVLVADSQFVAG